MKLLPRFSREGGRRGGEEEEEEEEEVDEEEEKERPRRGGGVGEEEEGRGEERWCPASPRREGVRDLGGMMGREGETCTTLPPSVPPSW